MMHASYLGVMDFGNLFTSDTPAAPLVLCDGDLQLERESRARSGTYFETVATELENISTLCNDKLIESEIERLVNELLYIQRRYLVIKKPSIVQRSDNDDDDESPYSSTTD